jgi:hypothetical protein
MIVKARRYACSQAGLRSKRISGLTALLNEPCVNFGDQFESTKRSGRLKCSAAGRQARGRESCGPGEKIHHNGGERAAMKTSRIWNLNKLMVLILMGGFVVILTQVRYDHRMVVNETAIAWTPIVFSILMIIACLLGLTFWNRGGRQVLLFGFLIAIVVGLLGFWLHTKGHLSRGVGHELSAWLRKIPNEDKPPALAPFAFVGFGLLGWIACSKRFQQVDQG